MQNTAQILGRSQDVILQAWNLGVAGGVVMDLSFM